MAQLLNASRKEMAENSIDFIAWNLQFSVLRDTTDIKIRNEITMTWSDSTGQAMLPKIFHTCFLLAVKGSKARAWVKDKAPLACCFGFQLYPGTHQPVMHFKEEVYFIFFN